MYLLCRTFWQSNNTNTFRNLKEAPDTLLRCNTQDADSQLHLINTAHEYASIPAPLAWHCVSRIQGHEMMQLKATEQLDGNSAHIRNL